MPVNSLLIAGPVCLDLMESRKPLLGGAGAMAAMAAAAIVPTQLWARVGEDFPKPIRQQFAERRIDDGGVLEEGQSNSYRLSDGQVEEHGPALPEAEPHDPVDLACCLAVGLDAEEGKRALRCFGGLPGADKRLCIIAPAPSACQAEHLQHCAQNADLLLLSSSLACRALGVTDPVAASRLLVEAGARAVALSAGPMGGLFRYKNLLGTWHADPQEGKDDRQALAVMAGVLAAQLCDAGSIDLRHLKRALAVSSAVAGHSIGDYGPKRLIGQQRGDYQTLFLKLRRQNKA